MRDHIPVPAPDGTTFAQWFLTHYALRDADTRASAIVRAVADGYGSWISPSCADTSTRPATHMHEITLFDVTATGATGQEAVKNWFIVAARVLTPPTPPDPSPATQARARTFALTEIVSRMAADQVAA